MYRLKLNNDVYEIEDPTEVIEYVRSRYPQAVMYADDGWIGKLKSASQLERATVERRRVLIWRTEVESVNDAGALAIGEVTRSE